MNAIKAGTARRTGIRRPRALNQSFEDLVADWLLDHNDPESRAMAAEALEFHRSMTAGRAHQMAEYDRWRQNGFGWLWRQTHMHGVGWRLVHRRWCLRKSTA